MPSQAVRPSVDYDFRIYPRPTTPSVQHASGGATDQYCGTGATLQPVSVSPLVTPSVGETVTYRWYDDALGTPGMLLGSGTPRATDNTLGDGVTYTPNADLAVSGTYNDYVSVLRWPDAAVSFTGCESYAATVTVDVTDAPDIDFDFLEQGTVVPIAQACIKDGTDRAAAAYDIDMSVTTMGLTPGSTLATGASLALLLRARQCHDTD